MCAYLSTVSWRAAVTIFQTQNERSAALGQFRPATRGGDQSDAGEPAEGVESDGRPFLTKEFLTAPPRSYQSLLLLTIRTTDNMTGTSMRTPTTVASAAPD